MIDEMDIEREGLFLLPLEDGRYCLYAPLRRAAAVINESVAKHLQAYLYGETELAVEYDKELISRLEEKGVIGGATPDHPTFPPDYEFRPYQVTLFPTSDCNLRCRYCYAEGGKRHSSLSWEAAKAAIDFIIENASVTGQKEAILGFHGGGEPTLRWDFMLRCTEYGFEKAEDLGLTFRVHAATNGMLNSRQREYIARHFVGINVSMDGPRDIQDRQRPRKDGSGSFDRVMETLKHFEDLNFNYSVRSTITSQSVSRIVEIMEFFRNECPSLEQLHIEPVWFCGRCRTSGEKPPSEEDFIKQFMRAWKIGKDAGIKLYYSGARLDTITNKFCAAPGDGFSVMPEGVVSSCFEVCDPEDPRAEIFHYGYFDARIGKYVFDDEKIRSLRRLTVDNIAYCQDCFCRWHCAGDCPAKVVERAGRLAHSGSERCKINREITLQQLIYIITERERENTLEGALFHG